MAYACCDERVGINAGRALLPHRLLRQELAQCHEMWVQPSFVAEARATAQIAPGIFSLRSPFTEEFAQAVLTEVSHYESECKRLEKTMIPPSVFAHQGALLQELGMQQFVSGFVAEYLSPLAESIFPGVGKLRSDDVLATLLLYDVSPASHKGESKSVGMSSHCDDSSLTLNICLGDTGGFDGGELVFDAEQSSLAGAAASEVVIPQGPGSATLFDGSLAHRSRPIRAGRRINLVFWCIAANRAIPPEGSFYDSYVRYLAHIGSRERAMCGRSGLKSLAFDVPAQFLRAGIRSRPPSKLARRLQRRGNERKLAVDTNIASVPEPTHQLDAVARALHRRDVSELLFRFLGGNANQHVGLDFLVMHQVCKRWHEFFSDIAQKAARWLGSGGKGGEIISLQVGGCGHSLGRAMWQLFCLEHDLSPSGHMDMDEDSENCHSFFGQLLDGRWRPRCVFTDLESDARNDFFTGREFALFDPEDGAYGKDSSSGLFARAHYTIGKELVDLVLDNVRKHAEMCNDLQGFLLLHALAGGTGSGFASLLLERLSVDYGKKCKTSLTVFPSSRCGTHVAEPYNTVLGMRSLIEHADTTVVMDDACVRRIVGCDVKAAPSADDQASAATVVAHALSSLTVSMRFDGALNCNLQELQANFVPYPRLHFLLTSLSPIVQIPSHLSVAQMTMEAFTESFTLSGCNMRSGKYLACALIYRGDVVPKDVMAAVATIKTRRDIQFVDWCPTGFKCGINRRIAPSVPGWRIPEPPRSALLIANNSSFGESICRVSNRFEKLYSQRAFVHHFTGEGMEEGEFSEAKKDLEDLETAYMEVCVETEQDDEDDDEY